ncbi:MAG: hypothetical protein HYV26_11255 [Candidatus Hydrogenedentes bacterium]|nr:hypothetical protein [Candidatus Hydrogenedentota bacterium]
MSGKLQYLLVYLALFLLIAGCVSKSFARTELDLSYSAFDQTLGSGWRDLADQEKYLEAARLIDRYEKEKQDLEEWQRINLRFHAGQLYAFAGENKKAIARFKESLYAQEPENSPVKWNAYVLATIAFLEQDLERLSPLREEIADGPKLQGVVPNLEVVDRLIKYYDEPYAAAYRGKGT